MSDRGGTIKIIINLRRHNTSKVDWLNTYSVLASNCSLQTKVHKRGSSSNLYCFVMLTSLFFVSHISVEAWNFFLVENYTITEMRLSPMMLPECA